jgi:hypothetical protein
MRRRSSRRSIIQKQYHENQEGDTPIFTDSCGMMEERRIQTLRSPHEAGTRWLARLRFGDGARAGGSQTYAAGSCLWVKLPKAPACCANRESGEPSRSFAGRGNQAAAPGDRRKTGLRVAGGGGALRGVPARKGSAARSKREGKAFPIGNDNNFPGAVITAYTSYREANPSSVMFPIIASCGISK